MLRTWKRIFSLSLFFSFSLVTITDVNRHRFVTNERDKRDVRKEERNIYRKERYKKKQRVLIDCASWSQRNGQSRRFLRLMQLVVEKAARELTRNTCLDVAGPGFPFFLFFSRLWSCVSRLHWKPSNFRSRKITRNNVRKNYMHYIREIETYLKIVDNWDPLVITLITRR